MHRWIGIKRHFVFTESNLQKRRQKNVTSTTETYAPLPQQTIPYPVAEILGGLDAKGLVAEPAGTAAGIGGLSAQPAETDPFEFREKACKLEPGEEVTVESNLGGLPALTCLKCEGGASATDSPSIGRAAITTTVVADPQATIWLGSNARTIAYKVFIASSTHDLQISEVLGGNPCVQGNRRAN